MSSFWLFLYKWYIKKTGMLVCWTNDTSNFGQMLCRTSGMLENWADPWEKGTQLWEEDWALSYNSIKFWDFPDISYFPKILSLWQLVRQFVYMMFITNNPAWLHLLWQENLVKHEKVSNIMTMIVDFWYIPVLICAEIHASMLLALCSINFYTKSRFIWLLFVILL